MEDLSKDRPKGLILRGIETLRKRASSSLSPRRSPSSPRELGVPRTVSQSSATVHSMEVQDAALGEEDFAKTEEDLDAFEDEVQSDEIRDKVTQFPTAIMAASKLLVGSRKHRAIVNMETEMEIGNVGKKFVLGDIFEVKSVDENGVDEGVLVAEGLNDNLVGVLFPEDNGGRRRLGNARKATAKGQLTANRSDSFFKLCPQLRYDMRKSLDKLGKREQANPEKRAYLTQRAEKEARENEEILERLLQLEGNDAAVRYGQVIQLQHVKSQKFLSLAPKKVATVQKDCLKLELCDEGSEWSWFKIMPRFKVRSEGSVVYYGDQIYLRSVKNVEYWLNNSAAIMPEAHFETDCTGLTERKPWREANLSVVPRTWRVHLSMRGLNVKNPASLYDCQAVYLFHAEVESLVGCSNSFERSDLQVVPVDRDARMKPDNCIWIMQLETANALQTQRNRILRGSSIRSLPQSSSASEAGDGRWSMRPERSLRNHRVGSITWGDQVSFRHLVTGRYLSLDETSLDPVNLSSSGLISVRVTEEHLGHLSTFTISPVIRRKKQGVDMEDDDLDDGENPVPLGRMDSAQGPATTTGSMQGGIPADSVTFAIEFVPPEPIFLLDGSRVDKAFFHAFNAITATKDEEKTPLYKASTGAIVFSLVKHDQDALQASFATQETVHLVESVKSWYRTAMRYSDLLRDRLSPGTIPFPSTEVAPASGRLESPTAIKFEEGNNNGIEQSSSMQLLPTFVSKSDASGIISVLQAILSTCGVKVKAKKKNRKGKSSKGLLARRRSSSQSLGEWDEIGSDEIEKDVLKNEAIDADLAKANQVFANALPPSDLSSQVRLTELHIFEILFHLISLPETLLGENWVAKLNSAPLRWCYFVQRIAIRAATAIFKDNREIELALAEKRVLSHPRQYTEFLYSNPPQQTGTPEKIGILMLIAKQLTCGLAAVAMLRQLVNNNKKLLDSKFKQPQVAKLVSLIRDFGPQKRYLDLLASLCTFEDSATGAMECVVSNQEMILQEIFYSNPSQVLVHTSVQYDEDLETTARNSLPQKDDLYFGQPDLVYSDGSLRKGRVLIHWSSSLFAASPVDLDIMDPIEKDGKLWISLEDLQLSIHPAAKEVLRYYYGLLGLFSKLAEGRSYNCIAVLEKQFRFPVLVLAISSTTLQPHLRAAFADLLKVIYLDRHPHSVLRVPRRVFYDDQVERVRGNPFGQYRDAPCYRGDADQLNDITSCHLVSDDDSDEARAFYSFSNPEKFDILRRVIEIEIRSYACSTEDNDSVTRNTETKILFIHSLVSLATQLLRLGFLPDPQHIISISQTFISILQLHEKRKLSRCSILLKQAICDFFGKIAQFDTDHNASLILEEFQAASKETRINSIIGNVKEAFALPDQLSVRKNKWSLLDLNQSLLPPGAKASMDELLVQIVIRIGNEADPSVHVFEQALSLLSLEHTKSSRLIDSLEKTIVISSPSGVRYHALIKSKTLTLLDDIQSYEIWGVSNSFSPVNHNVVERVLSTLRFLAAACKKHRPLIDCLNVVDVVLVGLRVEHEPSQHLHKMKSLCLRFLMAYVDGDPENQSRVFEELQLIISLVSTNRKCVIDCLSSIVRANRRLCVELPEEVLETLILTSPSLDSCIIGLLCQLCSVNGFGLKRNQDIILHTILQDERLHRSLDEILRSFEHTVRQVSPNPHLSDDFGTLRSLSIGEEYDSGSVVSSSTGDLKEPDIDSSGVGGGVPILILADNLHVLTLELLSAVTRGRNPFSEAKVQILLELDVVLDLLTGGTARMLPNTLRCVLLRFLADAFFDTGLGNTGTIQQSPRIVHLFEILLGELQSFEARNSGGDTLVDTMSDYRSLVFHGFCFVIRSFFHNAFDFHTAPNGLLALREPLLTVLQRIDSLAETPSEQHLVHRGRVAVMKSISGHRRAKRQSGVAPRAISSRQLTKEVPLDSSIRINNRVPSEERVRGKPNAKNWEQFLRKLKSDPRVVRLIEDEESNLIRSIVLAGGSFDTVIRFHKALMDHVRFSCEQHLMRPSTKHPLPKTADQTAQRVLTIIRFLLKYLDTIRPVWLDTRKCLSERLEDVQSRLTTMGAVDMCFELFCINTSQELDRATIETMVALLEGGNKIVQQRLFELFTQTRGEKFFFKLDDLFRAIGEAARLEVKLEKKRRAQEESSMNRQEGDNASAYSRGSSFLAESFAASSFALSFNGGSSSSSSTGSSDGGESESDDEEDPDTGDDMDTDFDSMSQAGTGEESDGNVEHTLEIDDLFELSGPRNRKSLRRRRTQAEMQQKQNARDIVMVVRFLQLCMEGHYLDMQNLFRDQSELTGHRHSVNVIVSVVHHAHILTKSDELLASAKKEVIFQLTGIFDLLIESMQGPCYENQLLLADPLHHVVEMIKKILLTSFVLSDVFLNKRDHLQPVENVLEDDVQRLPRDVSDALCILELKGKALRTLVSMLEGRMDKKVLEILASELDPSLLRSRFVEIHLAATYFEAVGNKERRKEFLEQGIDVMTLLTSLSDFHRDRVGLDDEEYSISDHRELFGCNQREMEAMVYFGEVIRSVEVLFKGSVHRIFFPRPMALRFLSHSSRMRLLQDIDVTDTDSRLQEFLESARSLLDEMTQIQQVSETIPSFIPIKQALMDLDFFRQMVFGFSLMTNFLLVLSITEQVVVNEDLENCSAQSLLNDPTPDRGLVACLFTAKILVWLQILLLSLLRVLHFGTQGPIVFKKLARKIRAAKSRNFRGGVVEEEEENNSLERSEMRSVQLQNLISDTLSVPVEKAVMSSLTLFVAFLSVSGFLVLRFGLLVLTHDNYIALVEVWGLSQILLGVRNERYSGGLAVGRRLGHWTSLWFCGVYDLVFQVESIFQLACIFACYQGLDVDKYGFLLTLPLFDIVLSNETLVNVVRAVVVPFQSLLMTFILLALTLYSFAFVAFTYFRDQFQDEETGENVCKTLLGCFLLSLDVGLRIGEGPAAVMSKVAFSGDDAAARYIFDLMFVVIISIFLLNVVFGIIIDTFSALRETQHDREMQLNNYCFICGQQRAAFDRIAFEYKQKQDELPHTAHREFKSGFFYHISNEHNLFDYLAFILHLEEKERTECNGVESFVLEELNKSGGDPVSWLPNGRALALGLERDESLSLLEQVEATILSVLTRQGKRINRLDAKLEMVLDRFHE